MAVSRPITARPFAPLAALLTATPPSVLGDEMARERLACDRRMACIIADALRREPYLSSNIFGNPERLDARLIACERAYLDLPEKPDPHDIADRTIRAIYRLQIAELSTAEALREARLDVAHTDRPGYWGRRASDWAHGRGFRAGRC